MPPRRRGRVNVAGRIAEWVARSYDRNPWRLPDGSMGQPFWRGEPDFVDTSPFNGDPNVWGFRFYPDGSWEPIPRGDEMTLWPR